MSKFDGLPPVAPLGFLCSHHGAMLEGYPCPLCKAERRIAELEREMEQLQVQLAGCGAAALGATNDPAKPGDYGYSASYGDVLALRINYDAARAAEEKR